ncbi:hypothetical protein BsWGS_09447 [Bradybaena similaris]
MKLYTDLGNFQTLKVLLAARLTGHSLQLVEVKKGDVVVPYFAKSKLPVLEVAEGRCLFSANTAAKYFYLKTNKVTDEDAENKLLDWEFTQLLPAVVTYLLGLSGHEKKTHTLTDQLSNLLLEVDSKLSKSKYLLGDHLTVSDICIFSTLFPLLDLKQQDVIQNLANLKQWVANINALETVSAAIKDLCADKGPEIFRTSVQSQNYLPSSSCVESASTGKGNPKTPVAHTNSAVSDDHVPAERVPQEEVEAVLVAWKTNTENFPKPRKREHPILPKENIRNILITSALPYVNNVPHLGNIIGCVLSADVFSRFCRLRNYNVLYICGTDEYGTATETKALEEGVTPKEICDKYNKLHVQIYKWFGIDFDYFGRTTTQQQTEIAQDIFWKLHKRGYIQKDSVDQLHCTKCDKFLADRFVEGTCPMCNYDDARGDQCDGCGKLINAVELKNPKCKTCKSSPVIRTSQHLFLDLPKLEPDLKVYLDKVFEAGTWTNNARVITSSWIRDGLKPRCISRDLKWGTPVPLEGYTEKVFYVWYDAPIGYISITATYTPEWQKWWKNPKQVELYNFLGKDNVPFHSVIFPACLLGADDNYTVVKHMVATEYLNYEDTKFSKSRNTGVFGDQAEETGIKADIYRFYLLFVRPESQDTAFSWEDFQLKNNGELLNNLGNFINRALMFLSNSFGRVIQEIHLTDDDLQLLALITRELRSYIHNLDNCRLRDGIRNILTISRLGNQYMQANQPWVLAKGSAEEKTRAGSVVSLCGQVSCLLSVLLQPYMPSTSAIIQEQLQAPATINIITGDFLAFLPTGHKIGTPSPLFQKIENTTIAELKQKFAGKPEEKPLPKAGRGKDKNASSKIDTVTQNSQPGNLSSEKLGVNSTTNLNGIVPLNKTEVDKLNQAVTDQGLKVRELKAAKADKSVVDAEVAVLLQLKKDLALAQGQNPDAAATAGKKKGKKK